MKLLSSVLLATAALVLLVHDTAWTADDEEPLGWYLEADLAGVWTGGNSESNTLGMGAKLRRLWAKSQIIVTGGATQTRSSLITRTATGTAADFVVNEDKVSETTAELYYVRGWYQYDLSPKFFTFGGVDWLKNRFAGIDSRFHYFQAGLKIRITDHKKWYNRCPGQFRENLFVCLHCNLAP